MIFNISYIKLFFFINPTLVCTHLPYRVIALANGIEPDAMQNKNVKLFASLGITKKKNNLTLFDIFSIENVGFDKIFLEIGCLREFFIFAPYVIKYFNVRVQNKITYNL